MSPRVNEKFLMIVPFVSIPNQENMALPKAVILEL